jgi:Hint domain-containing protein
LSWIALSTADADCFSTRGLGGDPAGAPLLGPGRDALMARGSLVFETRLSATHAPVPLVIFEQGGLGGFYLSVHSVPGGGLNMVLKQNDAVLTRTLNQSDAGRTDILRVTFSWDAPRRWGRLALERPESDRVAIVPVTAPRPMRVADMRALMQLGPNRYVAPEVLYLALSTVIEPVGAMPSLTAETPIATPEGYRPVADLKRGDLVVAHDGRSVPVLHKVCRTVPARGAFQPVQLRAPYFDLLQDITVGASQRLMLDGSDVEYLFGREEILIPSGHLTGTHSAIKADSGPVVTYTQILLPAHEAPIAAGCPVESLFIGRLRRNKTLLAASLLAQVDRKLLPEHAKSLCPVLPAFDAHFLAERRVA